MSSELISGFSENPSFLEEHNPAKAAFDLRKAYPSFYWKTMTVVMEKLGVGMSSSRFGKTLHFLQRCSRYKVKLGDKVSKSAYTGDSMPEHFRECQ